MEYILKFKQYFVRHFSYYGIITGFSFASIISLLNTPEETTFTSLSVSSWLISFAVFSLLSFLIPAQWAPIPAMAGTFLFFLLCLDVPVIVYGEVTSIWLLCGCTLLLGLLLWYALKVLPPLPSIRLLNGKLGKGLTVSAIVLLGIVCTLFIAVTGVRRHIYYQTVAFDFGIFAQMFESMRTTFIPYTTVERYELMSHFDVHISPILYLILPFYAIFPRPETIAVAQGVILGSSVIPLALICKKKGLSSLQTILFTIALAFFPALHSGTFYDFHENCFLTPLLLWFFYFMEKDTKHSAYIGMLVFAILIFAVKEDAPIYITFIALYLILSKRRPKFGVILLVLSVAYLFLAVWILNNHGDGAMSWRYENYLNEGQDSLIWVVVNALQNPGYTFSECFTAEKVSFLLQLLVPLGGGIIIFSIKHPSRLILLGPIVLITLMPDYPFQHSIYHQYHFGIVAILFYLAIINFSEHSIDMKRFLALFLALSSLLGFRTLCYQQYEATGELTEFQTFYDAYTDILDFVDRDRSVAAYCILVPHLYDCKELYEVDRRSTAEQIVLCTAYEEAQEYKTYFLRRGYTIEAEIEGYAVLLVKEAS